MAARYPRCAVLMWLHGVVRRRYVAAMVRCEEESGRVHHLSTASFQSQTSSCVHESSSVLMFEFKLHLHML